MFSNNIDLFFFCWTLYGVCRELKALPRCYDGFFGDECHYLSHCLKEVDENGDCLDSMCSPTWFGEKCQYKNLITEMETSVTTDPPEWVDYIIDDDFKTCTYFQRLSSIYIRFSIDFKFTFLRIKALQYSHVQMSILLENLEGFTDDCSTNPFTLAIDNSTFDVYCTTAKLISFIKLQFVFPMEEIFICSLYVSGGRNLALSQKVNFTSECEDTKFAERAIDGYEWNDNFKTDCTCNDKNDTHPTLHLTFLNPVALNYIKLYNREEGHKNKIISMSVQLYDENFTEIWNNEGQKSIIKNWIELNVSHPVKVIRLSETEYDKVLATVCEIQTFGDCSMFRWGLGCNNLCSKTCDKGCSAMDGSCDYINITVPTNFADCKPKPGSLGCNNTCPEHCHGQCNYSECLRNATKINWKSMLVNKKKPCSENCFNQVCSGEKGICLEGCYGFSNPPTCSNPCDNGTYGINCLSSCEHCLKHLCDSKTGQCIEGCIGYWDFPICKKKCPAKTFGNKCIHRCKVTCYHHLCDSVTGLCEKGCYNYRDPPYCTKPCVIGHGINCICEDFCKLCESNVSKCLECKPGFELDEMRNICVEEHIKLGQDAFASPKDSYVFIPVFIFILALTLASFSVFIYFNKKSSALTGLRARKLRHVHVKDKSQAENT